jgi:hypothetical protein
LPPSDFWDQTPRTFEAAMEGRAKAAGRASELAYFQAWATERFAREKRLKPFGKYVGDIRPRKPQTGVDVLAIFQGFQAAGIPVKIRKAGD